MFRKSLLTRVFAGLALGATTVLGAATTAQAQITGAGATFPALLYQKWAQQYKNATGRQVNYQGIGSSGGIKSISARAVDFGASDGPMTAQEMVRAPGVRHIPMCAGAVALAYNAPGVPDNVKLTGAVIADIYLGAITRWNDPRIASLNPGVNFPAQAIVPAFRSDGSGTTNIVTNYLSQVSPTFLQRIGVGKSVRWPKGVGGKGNAGVAALIQQTPGGFGYIELAYATENKIKYASVQNQKGAFVRPTLQSTTEAAQGARLPSDFRYIITNTADPQGYPITGFTWILVYQDTKPEVKQFLQWCLTEGQKSAAQFNYAPLPESVRQRALRAVSSLQ